MLADRVPSGSLAAVHLFFPDPWPKAKHTKRRFVSQHTPSTSSPTGSCPVAGSCSATDHDGYAAHARSELAAHGRFVVTEGERPPWRPTDGFEAKGLAAGRPVTEFRAVPRS